MHAGFLIQCRSGLKIKVYSQRVAEDVNLTNR